MLDCSSLHFSPLTHTYLCKVIWWLWYAGSWFYQYCSFLFRVWLSCSCVSAPVSRVWSVHSFKAGRAVKVSACLPGVVHGHDADVIHLVFRCSWCGQARGWCAQANYLSFKEFEAHCKHEKEEDACNPATSRFAYVMLLMCFASLLESALHLRTYLQIKSFQMLLHLTLREVTMMLKLKVSLVQAQPLVKLTLSKKIWIWSARLVCSRVWCSTIGMVLHHVIMVCNFQVEYLREELRKVRSDLSECVFFKEKAEAQLK